MSLTLLSVNNYHYPRGGAEVVFLRHNDMLKEMGWRVAPFCMEHEKNLPSDWSNSFVERIEYDGAAPMPLRERLRKGIKSVYSLEARNRIDTLLLRLNPDICHVHNVYHHISPSILRLIHHRGVPLVMTVHDLKIACPAYSMLTHDGICERCRPGGFFHVLTNLCMKGKVALSALVMVESYLHRLLGSYDSVDRFIVPSMFYLDKLVEWGFEAGRFDYVPNFVDASAYEPLTEPGDRILYFGRLSPEKGLTTLLSAAALARVKLDIVGEGPLKGSLEELARKLDLDVRFPGFLSGAALHEAVRAARAVVVPSEWYENAPISVLEAFALGKPVLAADIGGLSELVIDGESGWHFESGSVDHLAQRLREITDTPDGQIRERGDTALDRVRRHFSPHRYIDDIRTVYGRMGVLWN